MFIILAVSISGCEQDEQTIENNDEYYVKYVVKSRSIYSLSVNAEVKMDYGSNKSFEFNKGNWELIVGPVRKGFRAKCNAEFDTSKNLARTYIDVEIYVSENNGPFALKANNFSSEVRMSAFETYLIN